MHQLLIVDDQPDLVDDLAEMLPWQEIGIGQVHKAYSAQEALEFVQAHPIDVVITDIRMPGMTGLELIKRIRMSWKNIKCILLSGYDDFEYAKQGIQHQANDYLLKPVEDKELLESVKKALMQIDEQWQEITSIQNVQHTLRENIPILQNHLLFDLLQGRGKAKADLADKLKTLNIAIRINQPVNLILLRIEEDLQLKFREDTNLLDYAVFNIAEEIFCDDFELWYCKDAYGYAVMLIQHKRLAAAKNQGVPGLSGGKHEDKLHAIYEKQVAQPPSLHVQEAEIRQLGEQEDELDPLSVQQEDELRHLGEHHLMNHIERKAAQLQHYVKAYLKGTVSLLINKPGLFPEDIHHLYNDSLFSFRQHIGSERELLVIQHKEHQRKAQQRSEANSLAILHEPPSLIHLLEVGQWEMLQAKLDDVFTELEAAWGDSHEHILETYFTIVSSLIYSIHKSKRWIANILGEDFDTLVTGAQFHTIGQLRDWTFRVIQKYKDDMHSEMQDSRSNIVKQVQQFVSEHLATATLQLIAAHVYLNPSYLSKIYKMETGEGISEYVYRLKMDRAAHLLRTTNEKIYEIAASLGYIKTSYFIKLFKDKYGMTPQEYRDSLLH